uniref:Uncharacterized protein n=1 Tax=Caulobacter phage BL57 TaxID=3348355 RepID=A0AB74UIS4_9VIRU
MTPIGLALTFMLIYCGAIAIASMNHEDRHHDGDVVPTSLAIVLAVAAMLVALAIHGVVLAQH